MCNGSQKTLCGHRELVNFIHIIQLADGSPQILHAYYLQCTCRWGLSSLELCIISMLLSSLPPSLCRDIPIYLPKASNKVAHRLIVLTLLEGTMEIFWILCCTNT